MKIEGKIHESNEHEQMGSLEDNGEQLLDKQEREMVKRLIGKIDAFNKRVRVMQGKKEELVDRYNALSAKYQDLIAENNGLIMKH